MQDAIVEGFKIWRSFITFFLPALDEIYSMSIRTL